MHRLAALLLCCTMLGACTVFDAGVGRGHHDWSWSSSGDAYATYAWPANTRLVSADLVGGQNDGTLVSVDVWRLLHLELGVLGVGLGVGPFQVGAGFGWYDAAPPTAMSGDNIFAH